MKRILLFAVFVLLTIFIYIKVDYHDYTNQSIQIEKNCNLYMKQDDKFKKVGTVFQNTIIKPIKKEGKYYLLDSNYYILIEKAKLYEASENNHYQNYIPFNEKIITKKGIFLYQNNKAFRVDSQLSFQVIMKDDLFYYVLWNDQLTKIKKESVRDVQNFGHYNGTDSISVLDFTHSNYDKQQLDMLKDYLTISLDEFHKWQNNQINLPNNAILLIGSNSEYNHYIWNTSDEFAISNKAATKSEKNSYDVGQAMDQFQQMLNKEKIYDMSEVATSVPVLNYHFFYADSISCQEDICLHTDKFKQQLDYLRDNNYKVLTMREFINWYNGKMDLPKKSVLITIDDGALGTGTHNGNLLIPILEEYQMPATLFLITVWWPKENYQSKYLEVESHGYDIHRVGECNHMRIECLNNVELTDDIKTSINLLGTNNAFAYPFYDYTENSIEVLKNLGFQVAFVGGDRNATRSDEQYLIPRYPIYDSTTLDQFVEMVN